MPTQCASIDATNSETVDTADTKTVDTAVLRADRAAQQRTYWSANSFTQRATKHTPNYSAKPAAFQSAVGSTNSATFCSALRETQHTTNIQANKAAHDATIESAHK